MTVGFMKMSGVGRSRTSRVIAAVAAVAQLQACAPNWKRTGLMAPADVVSSWHPKAVQVLLTNGTWLAIDDPSTSGDSIRGRVTVGASREPVAFAQHDLVGIEKGGSGVRVRTRDGEIVELADFWMRGDSAGGHRRIAARSTMISVAVTDIAQLEVAEVPKVATRLALGGGVMAVASGERVRVTFQRHPGKETVRGYLDRVSGDTLRVRVDGGSLLALPFADVSTLEVRVGVGTRVLRGAGIGLAVAGVLALGGFAVVASIDDGSEGAGYAQIGAVALAGGLGLLAILIGTGVGAATRAEHWERVPLQALLQTSQ